MNQHRFLVAVLGFGVLSAPAHAEGGIKLTSEARMHPLVQTGFAFDSNPHRASGDTAEGDGFMLLQGGFELSVPSDRLDVRMNNVISYNHYLGLMADPTRLANTTSLSTVKGGSALQLLGNRQGKLRWGLAGKVSRLDEPEPLNLGVRQGRWSNGVDTFVEWRPSGGALGVKPAASIVYDSYDASGGTGATKLNKVAPGLRLDFDWRFLPRTQFVINNHWTSVTYTNDEAANGYADPVSSEIGVMGQFSPRLSAIIAVGYSGSQFLTSTKNTENATNTISGQAEIRYDERRKVTWRLGFRRRLLPVSVFGFMTDNSAYARYSEKYFGGLRVVTQLKVSARTFGAQTSAQDVIQITTGDARADLTAGFDANILWQPQKWWVAGLTNRFEYFTTNSQFKSAGVAGDSLVSPDFGRNLTMLVFEAKY